MNRLRRQEKKEPFHFFSQLLCKKQSISDLAIFSECNIKIEELCLNYLLLKLIL